MKRRYVYLLLFCIPAFLLAFVVAASIFGMLAGGLWLFVLGDDPWPAWSGSFLVGIFLLVLCGLWSVFLVMAFREGRRQESSTVFSITHGLVALGTTVLIVSLLTLYEWRTENPGAASATRACADYCQDKGFPASEMAPRDGGDKSCQCLDPNGKPTDRLQLD